MFVLGHTPPGVVGAEMAPSAAGLQVQRNIPPLALPPSQIKKGLPGRLQVVKYLMHKLEDEIDSTEKKHKQVRGSSTFNRDSPLGG